MMSLVFGLLPVLLVFQQSATDFIDQSCQAAANIKEGRLSMSMTYGSETQTMTLVRKGRRDLAWTEVGGRRTLEVLASPISLLYVNRAERTYAMETFPESKESSAAPEPLEKGRMKLALSGRQGLIFRSNPPFSNAKFVTNRGMELMFAEADRADGTRVRIKLIRDGKTKLPLQLAIQMSKDEPTTRIEFKFEERKVRDAELEIDEGSYKNFRQTEMPKSVKGED